MATYPTFDQLATSTEEFVDDLVLDRATNGSVKARAFYSARKRSWKVRHLLNATDLGTLLTFYDTYRLAANSFTWHRDDTAYTFLFDGPPQYEIARAGSNRLYSVTVEMVQQ